jgi:hypothetical protein
MSREGLGVLAGDDLSVAQECHKRNATCIPRKKVGAADRFWGFSELGEGPYEALLV